MGVANLKHADAWSEFWQDQDVGTSCLSRAPGIRSRLDDHWYGLAASLPPGTRVLDLGCGAGAAGRALLAGNPRLSVTGVDFAAVPLAADRRIAILSGTRMECMPFDDHSFDGAISQFGFEYGNVEEAAEELARVLRPGAAFSFLVHHSAGRIAVDSVAHRQALEAVSGPRLEAAFLSGEVQALASELAAIRHRFPWERIVEEAAVGLTRHIRLPRLHRDTIWRAILAAIAPELVMLDQLQASWVSPVRLLYGWLLPLEARFDLTPPAILTMAGEPLCWKFEGVRKA